MGWYSPAIQESEIFLIRISPAAGCLSFVLLMGWKGRCAHPERFLMLIMTDANFQNLWKTVVVTHQHQLQPPADRQQVSIYLKLGCDWSSYAFMESLSAKSPMKCEGLDPGNYPNPLNPCSNNFYVCTGLPYGIVQSCPGKTVFDPILNRCGYTHEVPECGGTTTTAPSTASTGLNEILRLETHHKKLST